MGRALWWVVIGVPILWLALATTPIGGALFPTYSE
jgi:hypothetical protein